MAEKSDVESAALKVVMMVVLMVEKLVDSRAFEWVELMVVIMVDSTDDLMACILRKREVYGGIKRGKLYIR